LHASAPLAIDAIARGRAGGQLDKFLALAGKFAAVAGQLARGPGVGR